MRELIEASGLRQIDGDGRSERGAGALRHRHDSVRQQERLVDVVRDHHGGDRAPGLRAEPRELLLQASPRQRVKGAKRLVQEQDFRIGGERPRDGDSLAHPARQLTRTAVHGIAESDEPEIALCLILLLRARPFRTSGIHGKPHVLECREPRQQRIVLEDDGRLSGDPAERLAVDRDRSGVRLSDAGQQIQQRRLPAAHEADNRDELSLVYCERHAIEHVACRGTERFRKALGFDERHGHKRAQPRLGHTHHAVEQESDDADRQDGEENVRVDQAVVLLPEKSAHARRAGQHLACDDHQPCDAKAQPEPREHLRQRRRQERSS